MTTDILTNEIKIYKKADQTKTVLTYIEKIPQDILSGFLKLAKGLKKNIVLIDWTQENIHNQVTPYKNNKEYLLVYLVNADKDARKEQYEMTLTFNDNKIKVMFLDIQYEGYPDNWHLLNNMIAKPLSDKHSYCYGRTTQSYICFYADILNASIFDRKLFMAAFIEYYLKLYPTLSNENDLKIKQMGRNFQRFVQNGQKNIKSQMKNKIYDGQREMLNHYSAIQRLERTIEQEYTLLRSVGRKFSGFNTEMKGTKLQDIFKSFLTEDRYIDIEYGDSIIEGTTGDIYCSNYGKKYFVGRFKVLINLNGTVKMTNIVKKAEENLDHPHISSGIPCLGNIKETVPKMINNGDFIGILNLLHNFLTSYSEVGGPYINLERGWGVAEDWCNNCNRAKLNCQCKICPNCEKLMDNCECEKCPRFGTLLTEIDCTVCEYHKEKACTY